MAAPATEATAQLILVELQAANTLLQSLLTHLDSVAEKLQAFNDLGTRTR